MNNQWMEKTTAVSNEMVIIIIRIVGYINVTLPMIIAAFTPRRFTRVIADAGALP